MAEDRKLFAAMLDKLGLRHTPSGSVVNTDEAVAIANKIGYPVLVRPSFVLGGRAMELVYHEEDLRRYMASAIEVRSSSQDATTLPRRQTSATSAILMSKRSSSGRSGFMRPRMMSKPSA